MSINQWTGLSQKKRSGRRRTGSTMQEIYPVVANVSRQFRKTKNLYIFFIILFLSITGLIGSFKTSIGLFGFDGDTSFSMILWHGISEYGVSWISDFIFTQDNWLLSLVPLHFIGFALFGAKTSVPIIFGWLIYICNASISTIIVWKTGAKKTSVLIFLLLINLNIYSYIDGLVSYPVAHNTTNFFGLLSILILINWIKKPTNWLLISLFIFLLCGAVSDPWMLASYNFPVFILSVLLLFKPLKGIDLNQSIKLSGVVALSIISAKTKLFGALYFLPDIYFSPGDWKSINHNAIYLIKDLGGLLNLIPLSGENSFISGFISLLFISYLLLYGIYHILHSRISIISNQSIILYSLAALLSTASIISAFIITDVEAKDYSARYLISNVYLIVILIGILSAYAWETIGAVYRYSIGIAIFLFFTTSLLSIWLYAPEKSFKFKDPGITDTISFLMAHGLNYGYGPYWAPNANANAVTAASNYKILIRPVLFDRNNGMMISSNHVQSSKRWYLGEDIPEGTFKFFVIVDPGGDGCPDINICLNGLKKQFGKPIKILTRGNSKILVWNHELLRYKILPVIRFSKTVPLNHSNNVVSMLVSGWCNSEPWGTWSDGNKATISFRLPINKQANTVVLKARPLISAIHPQQHVKAYVNGIKAAEFSLSSASDSSLKIGIPQSAKAGDRDGVLKIELELPDAARPADIGINGDTRKLALGVISIEVE